MLASNPCEATIKDTLLFLVNHLTIRPIIDEGKITGVYVEIRIKL